MLLMVSGARKRFGGHHCGDFVSPARRVQIGDTPVWAADNGCFGDFSPDKFKRMLDQIAAAPVRPKFVVVPDVVCDHKATVERWLEWCKEFHARKIPRAFVLQNGIEEHPPELGPPWNILDAIFIGGDNAFKFSPWVAECVRIANRAGIWVHMGRVNSVKRLNYARRIGCDSVDGSGMARFPDRVLLPMINSLQNEQFEFAV